MGIKEGDHTLLSRRHHAERFLASFQGYGELTEKHQRPCSDTLGSLPFCGRSFVKLVVYWLTELERQANQNAGWDSQRLPFAGRSG